MLKPLVFLLACVTCSIAESERRHHVLTANDFERDKNEVKKAELKDKIVKLTDENKCRGTLKPKCSKGIRPVRGTTCTNFYASYTKHGITSHRSCSKRKTGSPLSALYPCKHGKKAQLCKAYAGSLFSEDDLKVIPYHYQFGLTPKVFLEELDTYETMHDNGADVTLGWRKYLEYHDLSQSAKTSRYDENCLAYIADPQTVFSVFQQLACGVSATKSIVSLSPDFWDLLFLIGYEFSQFYDNGDQFKTDVKDVRKVADQLIALEIKMRGSAVAILHGKAAHDNVKDQPGRSVKSDTTTANHPVHKSNGPRKSPVVSESNDLKKFFDGLVNFYSTLDPIKGGEMKQAMKDGFSGSQD